MPEQEKPIPAEIRLKRKRELRRQRLAILRKAPKLPVEKRDVLLDMLNDVPSIQSHAKTFLRDLINAL
ncbi:hypothetical protein KAR91_58620 [Candidatus Pacearchaeota archaeon]|nr:hypothetical protein [Candidatus Pacearchaeota archaeon]